MLKRVGSEHWERSVASDPKRLRCDGLQLELGCRTVVGPVSFDLPAWGTTAIIGPNGAGKSCLLRLVHGLIGATGGIVHWGENTAGDEARAAQAMVFQKPVLLRRSVRANLDYVLSGRRADRHHAISELLAMVGLEALGASPARKLSGGEQQRLALARALAVKPSVLLLDEPTASLDPASVQIIESILHQQRDEGTKIILVTHDMGQARRLADDVVFMHRGQLVEQAEAESFFSTPKSEEARAYLAGDIIV